MTGWTQQQHQATAWSTVGAVWICGFGLMMAVGAGCVDVQQPPGDEVADGPDWVDIACTAEPVALAALSAGTCAAAEQVFEAAGTARHVPDDIAISYVLQPPSSGDHRSDWAKWGAYTYLPPQRWLHNLEHGGIAVLYDPCLDEASVLTLRQFLQSQPADDTGKFRWILTPYPGLGFPVALVAWERTLLVECWRDEDVMRIKTFLEDVYRQAPEDVPFDGRYDIGWLGR